MTYNGYKNYETWAVGLWLGDDDEWRDELNEMELYDAQNAIKDKVVEMLDDALDEDASLMRDLLISAIGEIDFYELAELWRSEVQS